MCFLLSTEKFKSHWIRMRGSSVGTFRYNHMYSRKNYGIEKSCRLQTKTRIRLGLEWEQTPDSLALGRSTVPVPTAVLGSHPSDGHFK